MISHSVFFIYNLMKYLQSYKTFESRLRIIEKEELLGKRVYVYYNLHTHTWSVKLGDRVVLHTDYIKLSNVEFRVRVGGREKVRREGSKNVHAFVIGNIVDYSLPGEMIPEPTLAVEVTYNPYRFDNFVVKTTEEELFKADEVEMIRRKVYASVGINEDINVDKGNLQRLKDYFSDEMKSRSGEDMSKIFDDNFIQTISDMCLELDDLGYDIRIYFPQYHKQESTEILPSCCIDIDSEAGQFLDNNALEMTIKEIQSYVSDFDLSVDIELGSDDQFVTADEFINQYNVEELDIISILIY
jgi:hypothetical protein